MKEEEKHFRVIVKIDEIIISFIAESKSELFDRLKFLYRGINIPQETQYGKDGREIFTEIQKKVIVTVVNDILDSYIFRLSDYKENIESL